MIVSFVIRVALGVGAALLLAGCVPPTQSPQATAVPLPEGFSAKGEIPLRGRWWRHFDDPALNVLQQRALAGSFTLAAARARLREARVLARIAGAAEKPQIDAGADASATRGDTRDRERYSADIAAGFELDLWGRLATDTRAAVLEAEASAFDLRAAAVTLTAEVANAYYRLRRQEAVIELLRRQRRTNERLAELLVVRYRNGQARADEVLRQQRLTEQSRGDLESARGDRDRLVAELAALVGAAPDDLSIAAASDTGYEVPALPQTGVPVEWLRRRPDLRAAFLRVRAADRSVASAIAARYPRLDLSLTASSTAATPGALIERWVRELAASLTVPLFRGGELRARVDRQRTRRAVTFNDYAQAVVDAASEVERALVDERADRRVLASLERQRQLAERAKDQLRNRQRNGVADFLDVLQSVTTLQNIERQLLEARWQLPLDRVALIRTLAGGAFGDAVTADG